MFKDKSIIITGGTGSFGNALIPKLLSTEIKEIRIFSRDEKKQDDMRSVYNTNKIKYYIGDVRDKDSLDYPMSGVDYVFHAAALKQIPSTEFFPLEAVKTNILGTDNVLSKAIQYKIKKVVCLSTDKSVLPISAMGLSKALMEKVIVAKSRLCSDTIITCTRYGNVLASRGSVIPLFVSQILQGKKLTVTNPEMTRFVMTLSHAVELVMFAFQNGRSGDIFVQKAPAVTIGQLAKVLLELFQSDTGIEYIGKRGGDKVHETLITKEEQAFAEDMGEYFRINPPLDDLSYTKTTSGIAKVNNLHAGYHSDTVKQLTNQEMKDILEKLDYIREQLSRK